MILDKNEGEGDGATCGDADSGTDPLAMLQGSVVHGC